MGNGGNIPPSPQKKRSAIKCIHHIYSKYSKYHIALGGVVNDDVKFLLLA
jgi:hypothetical protein